jgi:hypothetical protein
MTLKSILKKAGVDFTKALPCHNTIKSHILVLSGQQLLKLFALKTVGSLEVQRNDEARLKTRKASHIFAGTRPDTQSEFRAVWHKGVLKILDGNHRIRGWHAHAHLVMESVSLRIYETTTDEQVESLYASIDSRKCAKNSQDELWSIFNYAGFSESLVSEEMQTGKGLATVMKRFLPGTGIAQRGEIARGKKDALLLADELFSHMPVSNIRKVSDVFGGGELLAVLELAQSFVDAGDPVEGRHFSVFILDTLGRYIQYRVDGERGSKPAVADAFAEYEEQARIKGHKRTGERVVVARAAILKPLLQAYFESTRHAKSTRRMKAAA